MNDSQTAWPLDRSEHLADALREQGVASQDAAVIAQDLMLLAAWQAPVPTARDSAQLLARLLPHAPASPPATAPVRRAMRSRPTNLWGEFRTMLDLTRSQVSILRPSFWLTSALIVLLGCLLLLAGEPYPILLQVIGPLLSYLGTASAFRGVELHMLEFELACPPSPRQLTVARLVIVLSYDVAMGFVLSLLLWTQGGASLLALTLHWLAPLLFVAGAALLLSLRFTTGRAAAAAYIAWIVALLLSYVAQGSGLQSAQSVVTSMAELALSITGLALVCLTLISMPRSVTALLPRR